MSNSVWKISFSLAAVTLAAAGVLAQLGHMAWGHILLGASIMGFMLGIYDWLRQYLATAPREHLALPTEPEADGHANMQGHAYHDDAAMGLTPVQGVVITAEHLGRQEVYTAATRADGYFSLVVPPGRYRVRAERDGFIGVSHFGQPQVDEGCYVEFRLQRMPPNYA